MSAGTNFFVCSCAILALAIVNLNLGPSINHTIGIWSNENCRNISDTIDDLKETKEKRPEYEEIINKIIENEENRLSECRNKKAMYELEYAAFTVNAGLGFIVVILGLYGVQKEIIPKTGIIGIIFGIAGAILTLVYAIFNGIVYTNYYNREIYKVDGDLAFAELQGEKNYKCIYFNKVNDTEALRAKYSDLIKSQYNYNKGLKDSFDAYEHPEKAQCTENYGLYIKNCEQDGYIEIKKTYTIKEEEKDCEKLYYKNYFFGNYLNFDLSARFLITLILSLFTVICYFGLAFSGFMILKESAA